MGIRWIASRLGHKNFSGEGAGRNAGDISLGTPIVFKSYLISIIFLRTGFYLLAVPLIFLIVSAGDLEFFLIGLVLDGVFIGCVGIGFLWREISGAGVIISSLGIEIRDLVGTNRAYTWNQVKKIDLYKSVSRKVLIMREVLLWRITFDDHFSFEFKRYRSPQLRHLPIETHWQYVGMYYKAFGGPSFF